LDEAKTLARFKHPNIVSILNFFEENGTAYVVMPYEEGEPLDRLMRQGEITDEKSLLGILMPILDGLEKVHSTNLIHRDIKPANIYIRDDGSPVLIDFGSARTALGQQTRTLTAIVSPGYAPFEQYHGSGDKQGPWTDIYALGATLYAIINGGRGPTEATMRANVLLEDKGDPLVPVTKIGEGRYSRPFLEAVDAALAFRPDQRPQSISAWRKMFYSHQQSSASKGEKPKRESSVVSQGDVRTQVRTENRDKNRPPTTKNRYQYEGASQATTGRHRGLLIFVLLMVIGTGWYFTWQQGYLDSIIMVLSPTKDETRPPAPVAWSVPRTGKAVLYVDSNPSGSTVRLNGEDKGITPYEAHNLLQGEHQLELAHPEAKVIKERITLADNQITKKSYQLQPASGHFSIYSEPKGALIIIDGEDTQQTTPATIRDLKVGSHQLALTKDRYYPKKERITIKRDDTIINNYTLEGGHLVQHEDRWIEPEQRDQLVAEEKAKNKQIAEKIKLKEEAKAERIAEQKRLAKIKAKRIAEENRKSRETERRLAEEKRKLEEIARQIAEEKQKVEEETKRLAEERRKMREGELNVSNIVGSWHWSVASIFVTDRTNKIFSDGTFKTDNMDGTWSIDDPKLRKITFSWNDNWTHKMVVSKDGKTMTGTDDWGTRVTAKKVSTQN